MMLDFWGEIIGFLNIFIIFKIKLWYLENRFDGIFYQKTLKICHKNSN